MTLGVAYKHAVEVICCNFAAIGYFWVENKIFKA